MLKEMKRHKKFLVHDEHERESNGVRRVYQMAPRLKF